jgi:hypothetical protein
MMMAWVRWRDMATQAHEHAQPHTVHTHKLASQPFTASGSREGEGREGYDSRGERDDSGGE